MSGGLRQLLTAADDFDAGATHDIVVEKASGRVNVSQLVRDLAAALRAEQEWKQLLLNEARGRNPEGATALDFYAVWLDQERKKNAELSAAPSASVPHATGRG